MTTLLAFITAIALLVLFHEFGHYWVARKVGVKVLRFSLGFGKVIYRKHFRRNIFGRPTDYDTEWVISAIPLGGYVKMLDERETEVAPELLKYSFNRQPVLKRIAIIVAGPISNFLLAILLYCFLFVYGMPGFKPLLGEVPLGTPAAQAQMQPGETILSVDGEPVPSWQELRWKLLDRALRQGEVFVEAHTDSGVLMTHVLNLSSLEAKDLDREFLNKLGLNLFQPVIQPVIGKVVSGSVADHAGLLAGDVIMHANGAPVQRWREVVELVRTHPGLPVQLVIRRNNTLMNLNVTPDAVKQGRETIGRLGVQPYVDESAMRSMMVEVSYPPLEALMQSLRKTWETSVVSLKMLGKMVLGEVSLKNLSGPITIADYAGQSAEIGLVAYLGFLALISISLGVLNLLPIPLLDGGHLLYYVAELVKGSPVSERAWEIGQRIGIALLGALMVFAIYNDVNRLISG